jgi:hypothetical protein
MERTDMNDQGRCFGIEGNEGDAEDKEPAPVGFEAMTSDQSFADSGGVSRRMRVDNLWRTSDTEKGSLREPLQQSRPSSSGFVDTACPQNVVEEKNGRSEEERQAELRNFRDRYKYEVDQNMALRRLENAKTRKVSAENSVAWTLCIARATGMA